MQHCGIEIMQQSDMEINCKIRYKEDYMEKTINWPENANNAVMISVNLDAEYFVKMYYPDVEIKGSDFEAMGRYGMESGLYRLLDVLDKYRIKATFFVPGIVAEEYPEQLKEICKRGHEIGNHGYEHENMALLSAQEQKEAIRRGKEAIEKTCGVTPIGFRAPEGELTKETLIIAQEEGFLYSSTLGDNDVPYFNELDEKNTMIEIPIHWSLYDLPYFIFHFWPPIPFGQPRISSVKQVLTNWKMEYDGFYRDHSCFVLQLDPQITGAPAQLGLLEEILDYILEKGNAWFATGSEIYKLIEEL